MLRAEDPPKVIKANKESAETEPVEVEKAKSKSKAKKKAKE